MFSVNFQVQCVNANVRSNQINRLFTHNFLSISSNAYDKECAKSNSFPNQETLELLFRTKGMKIYKNFNEPRLKWFEQQREFARYMRQQVLYYTTIIRLINRKRGDRILSDGPPLEIDSENFTAEISQVPQSTQKSQDESEVSDADFDAILSNLDAIY